MQCTTITASRANQYPPLAPRKAAGETDRIENDIEGDVDCEGAGITIVSSVFRIDTADDDTTLVLGVPFSVGLVTYCPYSGGTAGAAYRVHNDVTTSDGLALTFTVQVMIAETVKIAFG